jgi:hypothetical protein
MKRIAILAVPLLALCLALAHEGFATTNVDAQTCHHQLDADRGKLAGVSDPAKKSAAYGHLKAAYGDEMANNFIDCLNELKAAEALMQ